jgi:hypothetical protein
MATFGGSNTVTDGLVLWLDAANRNSYPGSGNTWADLSGNNNSGSLVNSPTFSSANNGSLVFNGINSYVNIGDNKLKYQDNFSVEAVCRFTTLPNNAAACAARYPIVYNHDYGYNLAVNNNGQVFFQIYDTISTAGQSFTNSSVVGPNFFHVVGMKSGTTLNIYLNGIPQSTGSLTANSVYYTGLPFVIGGFATCGPSKFYATGNIAVVKVYNKVLSAQEVQQNYDALKSRYLNIY